MKSETTFRDAWSTVGAQLLSAQLRNTSVMIHVYARDSLGGQHNAYIALLAYLNVSHGGKSIDVWQNI